LGTCVPVGGAGFFMFFGGRIACIPTVRLPSNHPKFYGIWW